MTGRLGMKTGVPKWMAGLKECEKRLRKTLKKGHLERPYEELSRIDPDLHDYWERNYGTLVELITKAPLLVLRIFENQRKSILAFVKWWPMEYGDISEILLYKSLLRRPGISVEGPMADLKHIEEMLARRPGRPRVNF